jgi:hypothetical protein
MLMKSADNVLPEAGRGTALAHKLRRDQLIEPLPVLSIDRVDEMSDQSFLLFG